MTDEYVAIAYQDLYEKERRKNINLLHHCFDLNLGITHGELTVTEMLQNLEEQSSTATGHIFFCYHKLVVYRFYILAL